MYSVEYSRASLYSFEVCDLESGSFVDLFDGFKAGIAPFLEKLHLTCVTFVGASTISLCRAIEVGAFSRLTELDLSLPTMMLKWLR